MAPTGTPIEAPVGMIVGVPGSWACAETTFNNAVATENNIFLVYLRITQDEMPCSSRDKSVFIHI